jgi:hypothetical protein
MMPDVHATHPQLSVKLVHQQARERAANVEKRSFAVLVRFEE